MEKQTGYIYCHLFSATPSPNSLNVMSWNLLYFYSQKCQTLFSKPEMHELRLQKQHKEYMANGQYHTTTCTPSLLMNICITQPLISISNFINYLCCHIAEECNQETTTSPYKLRKEGQYPFCRVQTVCKKQEAVKRKKG